MFIHQIDIKTTLLLKDFLQTNDVWKLVAADFGFNTDEMNYFTAKDSVDRMWAALESRNYSVSQLEDILAVRELLRPLEILHNFVENRWEFLRANEIFDRTIFSPKMSFSNFNFCRFFF